MRSTSQCFSSHMVSKTVCTVCHNTTFTQLGNFYIDEFSRCGNLFKSKVLGPDKVDSKGEDHLQSRLLGTAEDPEVMKLGTYTHLSVERENDNKTRGSLLLVASDTEPST